MQIQLQECHMDTDKLSMCRRFANALFYYCAIKARFICLLFISNVLVDRFGNMAYHQVVGMHMI